MQQVYQKRFLKLRLCSFMMELPCPFRQRCGRWIELRSCPDSTIEVNQRILLVDGTVIKDTFHGTETDIFSLREAIDAVHRYPEITNYRDFDEEDPKEVEATGHGLNYIALDGNVGCIVNGAGLAMATMDAITLHGGSPANFLDAGGGSKAQSIIDALEVITSDSKVKAILFNIFGGITRCDDVAQGILMAREQLGITVPMVIRLVGTNETEGRDLLQKAGLTATSSMTEAVQAAVAQAREGEVS